MTKQQFHARIWAKLVAFSRWHSLIEEGDRILIAVSGGPDSIVLADHLSRLARRMKLRLHILHLNHGLRGAHAEKDAEFVERFGRELDIETQVESIAVAAFAKTSGRSLEDAARHLRYRALARAAKRRHCNKIATGHQLDDQAETFFLNLLRGTRARGLAGIPVRRKLSVAQKGRFPELIRPLLCLSRGEVMAYARHHGLRFAVDSTNSSDQFTRNWIRRRIIPLLQSQNPAIRDHIAAIAAEIALSSPRPK